MPAGRSLLFCRSLQFFSVSRELISVFVVRRSAVKQQQGTDVQRRLVVEPVIVQRHT